VPGLYHLNGFLTPATTQEGIYYMMFRSSTHYYVDPKSTTYKCDLTDYGYFYNRMD